MKFKHLVISSLAILLFACSKNEDATPTGKYSSGVFIVNEGQFQTGTGTVSFFNRDKTVENDIFQTVNSRPLGNILQSMEVHNDKAYLVVNNAKKVEVVQAWDFKEVGTIQGLEMPRYFIGIDDKKGYVSQWGVGGVDGSVKVIDLQTNMVIKTIAVGKGAEKMLKVDNKVFVSCNGGFASENKVFVIDTQKDEVSATIITPEKPNGMVIDSNRKIWVLTTGANNGKSSLIRINTNSNSIELELPFDKMNYSSQTLTIDSDNANLYFIYDSKLYLQPINATTLQLSLVMNRYFYGLGFDPFNKYLYCADAGSFNANGKILRYEPSSKSVRDSLNVGIIPAKFYFSR